MQVHSKALRSLRKLPDLPTASISTALGAVGRLQMPLIRGTLRWKKEPGEAKGGEENWEGSSGSGGARAHTRQE